MSGRDKMLAVLVVGVLAAGVAVGAVRETRKTTTKLEVEPTLLTPADSSPDVTMSIRQQPIETVTAVPQATQTFAGRPPLSPAPLALPTIPSKTSNLPHTGLPDRAVEGAAFLTLLAALGAAAALARGD